MPTDITSLLGGGTTETLSGMVYPSPPVVDVTRQIIAINEDPTLTGQQKADKIAALSGISYSYVQNNPQVNYNGNLFTSTPEDKNTIATTLSNLYKQLANPSDNPLIVNNQNPPSMSFLNTNQPTTTSASDTGLGNPTGSDHTLALSNSSPLQSPQTTQNAGGILNSFSSIFSKYGIWIILGIILFVFILKPRKMEYSPKTLEAMR